MDTHSRSEMVVAVLWSTFRTYSIMEEYMRYGIENHPSISSEYVIFLTTNSAARGKEGGGEEMFERLEERVDEVEKVAKGAKYAAGTVSNGLDQLKNRAEKMEKKVEKK